MSTTSKAPTQIFECQYNINQCDVYRFDIIVYLKFSLNGSISSQYAKDLRTMLIPNRNVLGKDGIG
jgi:hypothetical protein